MTVTIGAPESLVQNVTKTRRGEQSPKLDAPPSIRCNSGPFTANVEWMRATTLGTSIEEMRWRLREDGYLWVKNVLPREDVFDFREEYFAHMACTGLLKPGVSPREGIFNTDLSPDEHTGLGASDLPPSEFNVQKIIEAHRMPQYLKFLEHPKLREFVRHLSGWKEERMITRHLLRHTVPGGKSTGIHYDKIFLRGGKSEFLTAWIPIGDVNAGGGGLAYLKNSEAIGRRIEEDFWRRAELDDLNEEEKISAFNKNMMRDGQLAHGFEEFHQNFEWAATPRGSLDVPGSLTEDASRSDLDPDTTVELTWLVANYEAGDIVFHNPWMIHAATSNENTTSGVMRLSSDVRFYEKGDPDADWRWEVHWVPNDGL